MICEKCDKEYADDFRIDPQQRKKPSRFCSSSCSHSRPKSEASKVKVSETLRKKYGSPPKTAKVQKPCPNCGQLVLVRSRQICCSRECSRKLQEKTRGPRVSDWRRRLKKKLVDHKGGKCEICGFNKHQAAMQFHHRDPEEKDFAIGASGSTRSLSRCLVEVEKCMLLCANCHSILHHELWEAKRV